MRNVNEEMKDLLSRLSLCLFAFLLFSCMDMDDTTPPVKTTIQLVMPAEFVNMTDLSGMTVTLQSSIETVTAMSDSVGVVSLTELALSVVSRRKETARSSVLENTWSSTIIPMRRWMPADCT